MNDLDYIKNELNQAVSALTETGKRLKTSAKNSVNKHAEYQDKKNQYLIELKAEENADPKKKRTDAIREAMYRLKFKNERLAWQLAEVDYVTDRDLFKGLQSKINALQTIARLSETEYKTGLNLDDEILTIKNQVKLIVEALNLKM